MSIGKFIDDAGTDAIPHLSESNQNMSSELTLVSNDPSELMRRSTDIAGLCKAIVTKTAIKIQNRSYVKVEGWMSIATAHGCLASANNVEMTPEGCRAIGELRRMSDGAVICTAEGFVGADEPTWYGGVVTTQYGTKTLEKRADYAIRAMAQTRAISRVCRSAFAHVVVMMDAGLQTTPAEEVPEGGFQDSAPQHTPPPKQEKAPEAKAEIVVPRDEVYMLPEGMKWGEVPVHFGKHKGKTLDQLENQTIAWYLEKWEPKPYGNNTDISPADKLLKAGVQAWDKEMQERGEI